MSNSASGCFPGSMAFRKAWSSRSEPWPRLSGPHAPHFGFWPHQRCRPRRGTRFHVLDLSTGSRRGTCQGEPFFAFHHVNAYEHGNEIILDACAYDDAGIVDALYLDRLRSEDAFFFQAEDGIRDYKVTGVQT